MKIEGFKICWDCGFLDDKDSFVLTIVVLMSLCVQFLDNCATSTNVCHCRDQNSNLQYLHRPFAYLSLM